MTSAELRVQLGELQRSVVEIYCTDDAHEGAFPARVVGGALVFEPAASDGVRSWLVEAANSLDDEARDERRDAADRALARAMRSAAERLASRVARVA